MDKTAKKTCRCLVVANPANTNCLALRSFAKTIPAENFSCLTRLDFNRAKFQVADKLGVPAEGLRDLIIWGNHSSTMFPDIEHAYYGD